MARRRNPTLLRVRDQSLCADPVKKSPVFDLKSHQKVGCSSCGPWSWLTDSCEDFWWYLRRCEIARKKKEGRSHIKHAKTCCPGVSSSVTERDPFHSSAAVVKGESIK